MFYSYRKTLSLLLLFFLFLGSYIFFLPINKQLNNAQYALFINQERALRQDNKINWKQVAIHEAAHALIRLLYSDVFQNDDVRMYLCKNLKRTTEICYRNSIAYIAGARSKYWKNTRKFFLYQEGVSREEREAKRDAELIKIGITKMKHYVFTELIGYASGNIAENFLTKGLKNTKNINDIPITSGDGMGIYTWSNALEWLETKDPAQKPFSKTKDMNVNIFNSLVIEKIKTLIQIPKNLYIIHLLAKASFALGYVSGKDTQYIYQNQAYPPHIKKRMTKKDNFDTTIYKTQFQNMIDAFAPSFNSNDKVSTKTSLTNFTKIIIIFVILFYCFVCINITYWFFIKRKSIYKR